MFKRLIAYFTSYTPNELNEIKKALEKANEIISALQRNENRYINANQQLQKELDLLKLKHKGEFKTEPLRFSPEQVATYVRRRAMFDSVSAIRVRSFNEASKRSNATELHVPVTHSSKYDKCYDYTGLISFKIIIGRGNKCILNIYSLKSDGTRGNIITHAAYDSVKIAVEILLQRTGFVIVLVDKESLNPYTITTRDSFTMTGVDMANGVDQSVTQTIGSDSNEQD